MNKSEAGSMVVQWQVWNVSENEMRISHMLDEEEESEGIDNY